MNRYEVGKMVKSMAGHDDSKVYVIIKSDDEYVYLSDGDLKTIDNPKKKKKRHVQIINQIDDELLKIIAENKNFNNEAIKHAIKKYKQKKS